MNTLIFHGRENVFKINNDPIGPTFDGIIGQWTGVSHVLRNPVVDSLPLIFEEWDFWSDDYDHLKFAVSNENIKLLIARFVGKTVSMASKPIKIGGSHYHSLVINGTVYSAKKKEFVRV